MKSTMFFICLLMVGLTYTYAQDMNWTDGKITYVNTDKQEAVDYGTFSSFKIKNINLFLYSVTISGNRIDLQTPIPTELQTLFRLPSTQLASTATVEEVKKAIVATESQARNITVFKNLIVKNNLAAVAFNKTKRSNQALRSVHKNTEDAATNFEQKLSEFLTKAKTVSNDIEAIKLARVKLVNLAQRDVTFVQMTSALGGVVLPNNPSTDYQQLLKAYDDVQEQYDIIAGEGEDTTELDRAIEKMKKTLKAIQDENPATLYADVDFLNTELANEKNFIAIAPPVQADSDFINYNVSITPTRTNNLGAYRNPVAFDFDIPVKGGWKTDFSVGPTFSFGSGAKDEKYYFEQSSTEGKSILKQRGNNNVLSPGLAAMMHFYKRSGKDWSWGGMLGIGAGFQSFDDADFSVYTGISFVLGKSQKIMLSSGISFLNVERLKEKEYSVNTEYTSDTSLNDVTEKVIKSSFFLSLSYNLTSRSSR